MNETTETNSHDIRYVERSYQYECFDDYFKIAAPYLWNVKQWNNETIKGWLEAAFEDARKEKTKDE